MTYDVLLVNGMGFFIFSESDIEYTQYGVWLKFANNKTGDRKFIPWHRIEHIKEKTSS